jgi:hypothetical protein
MHLPFQTVMGHMRYNWKNAPIDGDAMYAPGGRKAHGQWDHYYLCSLFWCFIQMHFTSFELCRYAMSDGLIDSTQVQPQRGSSYRSSGGSTFRCRTEQDIAAEKMKHWMRQNEEYNLQMHEYYRQREEQQDVAFAQQQEALQVSMICITKKLHWQSLFQQQGIPFPQVQLPPLQPPLSPQSWMHHTRHASVEVCQTWSIIDKFILLLFIMLNLVTSSYLVNYSLIWWLWYILTRSTKDRA